MALGGWMDTSATGVGRKVTVPLIPKVVTDLAGTRERRNLTETDIVNRAISLYEFLDEEAASGAEIVLRRRDGSSYLIGWL
jgi:hypothetical protein